MRDATRVLLGVGAGLVVLAAVVIAGLFLAPGAVGAEASYVVLSDSMSPTIEAGDVVVVRPTDPAAIEEGDIITFSAARQGGPDRVTHRVVAVRETAEGRVFRTKGDANEEPDPEPVPAEAVVGTVWVTIPLVGHLLVFAGTDLGILAFVVVPAVMLVINEVYTMLRESETDGGDPE
ncbi:MAG: signal peptidase I [Halorientalis sp.]